MTDQVGTPRRSPRRREQPAAILAAAIAAAAVVLVTFVFTTLIHEPASIVTLLGIVALSIALDHWWKRSRTSRAGRVPVVH